MCWLLCSDDYQNIELQNLYLLKWNFLGRPVRDLNADLEIDWAFINVNLENFGTGIFGIAFLKTPIQTPVHQTWLLELHLELLCMKLWMNCFMTFFEGSIRISFGYMSRSQDVDILVNLIKENFVESEQTLTKKLNLRKEIIF